MVCTVQPFQTLETTTVARGGGGGPVRLVTERRRGLPEFDSHVFARQAAVLSSSVCVSKLGALHRKWQSLPGPLSLFVSFVLRFSFLLLHFPCFSIYILLVFFPGLSSSMPAFLTHFLPQPFSLLYFLRHAVP
jgi:hypothetical protein